MSVLSVSPLDLSCPNRVIICIWHLLKHRYIDLTHLMGIHNIQGGKCMRSTSWSCGSISTTTQLPYNRTSIERNFSKFILAHHASLLYKLATKNCNSRGRGGRDVARTEICSTSGSCTVMKISSGLIYLSGRFGRAR